MSDSSENTDRLVLLEHRPGVAVPELIVVRGPGSGTVHRLGRAEMTIGRAIDADVRVVHWSVSRRHARLAIDGERVFVADLGSMNGTAIGGERVYGRRLLRNGEIVTVGRVALVKVTDVWAAQDGFKEAAFVSAGRKSSAYVGNQEYLLDRFRAEYAHAIRRRAPLVLLFIRADRIAALPATTLEVEAAIDVVGAAVRQATRVEDVIARWSPSELVAMVRSDALKARLMSERIRSAVRAAAGARSELPQPQTATVAIAPINVHGASRTTGAQETAPSAAVGVDAMADAIVAVASAAARAAMRTVEDRVVDLPAIDPHTRAPR